MPVQCVSECCGRFLPAPVSAFALILLLAAPPSLRAQQPTSAGEPGAETLEYRIAPGDVLQLFVWKEPELSRDLPVRFDGQITAPLLGDVEAAGKTVEQLAAQLTKMFTRFLAAPQITVGVSQANSARFFVIGQVNAPGAFPLSGRITLLQGLALAGGFKEFARTDSILIVRQDKGFILPKGRPSAVFNPVNYKKLEGGKDISQNILLRPGDTILVP